MHDDSTEVFASPQEVAELEDAGYVFGRLKRKTSAGRIAVHKDDVQRYVLPEEVTTYLNEGWTRGLKKYAADRSNTANRCKNSNWMTNGVKSVFVVKEEQQDYINQGFYYGRCCRHK